MFVREHPVREGRAGYAWHFDLSTEMRGKNATERPNSALPCNGRLGHGFANQNADEQQMEDELLPGVSRVL
jgi:hypothetical protein